MLYIFKNISINNDASYYTIFNLQRDFLNKLKELDPDFLTIDNDKFIMGNNSVALKDDIKLNFNVSYVAYEVDNVFRFYTVTGVSYISGYYSLNLKEDIWANYINKAQFMNTRVTRCNRNIGNGIYDPITLADKPEFSILKSYRLNELCFVATMTFVTKQPLFEFISGTSAMTNTFVFRFDQVFQNIDNDRVKFFEYIEELGAIYEFENGEILKKDARVISLAILPLELVYYTQYGSGEAPTFNSYTLARGGRSIQPDGILQPVVSTIEFDLTVDPDYRYRVGTDGEGLDIYRTTKQTTLSVLCYGKRDGVSVIIRQGDKELDITKSFTVGITTNDGNTTAQAQMSKALGTLGSVASSVFQFASGGAGYVTGALSMANALSSVVSDSNAKYSPAGDGLSTFDIDGQNNDNYIVHPFTIIKCKSKNNEAKNADIYGVTFNEAINIYACFNAPAFINPSNPYTLITATTQVLGVPNFVSEYIQSVFNGGAYFETL